MSRPFLAVIGAPGTGKTTSVLTSFHSSYLILSSESNVHYFKKLLKKGKLPEGCRPPKKTKLIDTHTSGVSSEYAFLEPTDVKMNLHPETKIAQPYPQQEQLDGIVAALLSRTGQAIAEGHLPPYQNIVIDELGEFAARVHREILATCVTRNEKTDTRGAFQQTGIWLADWLGQLKQFINLGVGVAVVLHDREPDGDKKGGPSLPSATMAEILYRASDGVIQRIMKDGNPNAENPEERVTRRIWNATAGEHWNRKLRGLEPEDVARIGDMELYDILELCGFDMV